MRDNGPIRSSGGTDQFWCNHRQNPALGRAEGIPGVEILLVGPLTGPAANAATSNPLMIAEIAEGGGVPQANTTSANDGSFVFRNLVPGQYTLRARREGYTAASPALAGGFPTLVTASVIVVAGTPVPAITLEMAQGGTISGRVRDPDGQPATGLTVTAYQIGYRDGREALNPVSSRQTDDRGDYRLYWLPPGAYYVAVAQTRQAGIRNFYPSASDVRSSLSLAVSEGTEMSGMDINIRTAATFKVSGRLVNTLPASNLETRPRSAMFYLVPRDPGMLFEAAMPSFQNYANTAGEFELRGVTPGSYDLIATVPDSAGRPYPGRVRIEVRNQDLEGVALSIHPGVQVKVRVFVDGKFVPAPPTPPTPLGVVSILPALVAPPPPPPPPPPGATSASTGPAVRVQLRSRELYSSLFDTAAASVTSDATGVYLFPDVPESLYAVTVSGVPQNSYVADIREGGASISDSGLTVGERAETLIDVLISSGAQSIRGIVRNAEGKPAASATLVLVPPAARRQNPSLFRTFRTNINGEFSVNNVAPGDYKLFAWETLPNTAYMNAAFMEKYEVRGRPVTLAPGGDSNFDLTLIPYEPNR
jgi:sarcosine oxidase gamma subunit